MKPPRVFFNPINRNLNVFTMYDLDIVHHQVEENHTVSVNDYLKDGANKGDVCVLVGDNITIQEHSKKVRFVLPTTDVSGNLPLSLFSVEEPFGTSYNEGLPLAINISTATPTVQQTGNLLTWKQRFALKGCFVFLISIPFIMVAIIQPWNDGPQN